MSELKNTPKNENGPVSYRDAGVDVDAANALVSRIKTIAGATCGDDVVASVGGFASLYRLPESSGGSLLVASCDGVGTKLKVAFATGRHGTIGIDLVAMNVNDLICTGARPLFFLDYFATGALQPELAAEVIEGIAKGCQQAQCALVGGETAEMPDMYPPGEYDLAGFAVGLVEERAVCDGRNVASGDVVIGLPSVGLHSNGYSLARKVLVKKSEDLETVPPELGCSLADALLEPTRIYVDAVQKMRSGAEVRALVHITGGGLIDNPPRCSPENVAWRFQTSAWEVPPLMQMIQQRAQLADSEMRKTFNMGLGMLAVVPADQADAAIAACGYDARVVGSIVPRTGEAVEFTS